MSISGSQRLRKRLRRSEMKNLALIHGTTSLRGYRESVGLVRSLLHDEVLKQASSSASATRFDPLSFSCFIIQPPRRGIFAAFVRKQGTAKPTPTPKCSGVLESSRNFPFTPLS